MKEELKEILISQEMVLGNLMGLKPSKSPGPEALHPRVLKEVALEIADTLVIIFQNSVDSGRVPMDWRVANVTPLFKKGAREKMGNYRLVTLTSVVTITLESIIKHVVTEHLESSDRIGPNQHGFTEGKSSLTNILELFEHVTSRVDLGESVNGYPDFQKAFDKVPHKRLVRKMKAHGIG
eukprot:g16252.t1